MTPTSRPLRILSATAFLLAGALLLAWLLPPLAWQPPGPHMPAVAEFEPIELLAVSPQREEWTVMLERPPFDPARNRRVLSEADIAPANAQDAAAPDPLSGSGLVGVVQTARTTTVLLRRDGSVQRLRVGERIGRWKLTGVDARAALFVDDAGQTRELALQRARQPAAGGGQRVTPRAETPAGDGTQAPTPAEVEKAETAVEEEPVLSKSLEQRIAERRAQRDARRRMQAP